ncbi:type II toxin-antitoxin system VapC family toxin [Limnobacter sp.]|uniref:type II toxin-antitoxin system VapC family toxin n=1 Tax=Limnobacter sp. TaxID=2003368 RepID=UPI0027345A52|nr:type II toxin-antitoxin system VapC family toxin [Limnobacter sp.]MDP3187546.1 type II toxin-antitoxin system VapC family toxin [Limnobacter sp.]
MIYLLDTNILIYLIKNQPPSIAQKVNSLTTDAKLCMSFVSWAELLKGAERSNRKAETLRRLDQLAQQINVTYPDGPAICKHYAEQFTRLKDAGTPIGANDLWIACHALAEKATLVTPNTKGFLRITDLTVEDWVF